MSTSIANIYGRTPSAAERHFNNPPTPSSSTTPTATRPGMRRKSSASNLLTSFKSGMAIAPPISSGFVAAAMSDWDAQSHYSETSTAPSIPGPPLPLPTGQQSSDLVRDTVRKRISTLQYLKGIHEGQSHWLSTVIITRADLERTFAPVERRRAHKFALLGMSLANVFEVQPPLEFLKSLLVILQEYENVPEENVKPKMRNLFRTNKQTKKGGSDFATASTDPESLFVSPNIPFALDYFQVCFAFFDVLSEVYKRFSTILGPSHSPLQPSQAATGFGIIPSPQTTVSTSAPLSLQTSIQSIDPNSFQLDSPVNTPGMGSLMNTLLSVQSSNGSSSGLPLQSSSSPSPSTAPLLGSTTPVIPTTPTPTAQSTTNPGQWTQSLTELFSKIDAKFMRILKPILQAIDQTARKKMQDELASLNLNPLLAGLSSGVGSAAYEYDDR
ncbi:hypothetical protein FRC03_011606 [Tulasnella sp. 419]|nr:hypothetical protein FRC03_011606 [Tulasnella sp. 419]